MKRTLLIAALAMLSMFTMGRHFVERQNEMLSRMRQLWLQSNKLW